MSGFSISERVEVASVCHEWMEPLVGHTGTIAETKKNKKTTALKVELPGGALWFREKDLRPAAEEKEKAS
jgi:hypothetical protein